MKRRLFIAIVLISSGCCRKDPIISYGNKLFGKEQDHWMTKIDTSLTDKERLWIISHGKASVWLLRACAVDSVYCKDIPQEQLDPMP